MNAQKRPENFRKLLLNRLSISQAVTDCIEYCLSSDDETTKHYFHKIMVHNWSANEEELFSTLSDLFNTTIIPVNYNCQGHIATFYTSNLNLVLKLINFDFMFPFQRNMFNVDVLFNDKTSEDCFGTKVTIDDIVSKVVTKRFNGEFELNLSNFCSDEEFEKHKIYFYKLILLSHFKILMLRIGRSTKSLDLSSNNLSQVPMDILNFFIKGDLISINLSNNNIPSMSEIMRVSSRIEKLWVEGNPLCEDMDSASYVKQILVKFPRLTELDGVKINQFGMNYSFFKNYLSSPDKKTKMLVEKFLTLYFTHYDSDARRKIDAFYDINAKLSITHDFTDTEIKDLIAYESHSRNALHSEKRKFVVFNNKLYNSRNAIAGTHCSLPKTEHDPSTFTVDVLDHGKLIIIVDGVFRERDSSIQNRIFRFRRTFVFKSNTAKSSTVYHIINEMYNISYASKEQKECCFKEPIRNLNSLCLINPEASEVETVCRTFCHLTNLKKVEAILRLKMNNWDIRKSIKDFLNDIKKNAISEDKFFGDEEDDISDLSSISDYDLD